jgi:hypothetical protein
MASEKVKAYHQKFGTNNENSPLLMAICLNKSVKNSLADFLTS